MTVMLDYPCPVAITIKKSDTQRYLNKELDILAEYRNQINETLRRYLKTLEDTSLVAQRIRSFLAFHDKG